MKKIDLKEDIRSLYKICPECARPIGYDHVSDMSGYSAEEFDCPITGNDTDSKGRHYSFGFTDAAFNEALDEVLKRI